MLELESILVDRIKEAVPKGTHVLTANDLAGVREHGQMTPAVHVYPDATRPDSTEIIRAAPGTPAQQRVTQTWAVVVVTRNASNQRSAEHARSDASELLTLMVATLLGWLPDKAFTRLFLAAAPRPFFGAGGVVYFPLLFTTSMTLHGVTADGRASTAT